MSFEVTSLYGAILAVMTLVLFVGVSKKRAELSVSIGDAGNVELLTSIRRHGNFIESVPIVLIMMMLAESLDPPVIWLHFSGIAIVLGRLIHPFGLKADQPAHALRIVGNCGMFLALAITTGIIALHRLNFV